MKSSSKHPKKTHGKHAPGKTSHAREGSNNDAAVPASEKSGHPLLPGSGAPTIHTATTPTSTIPSPPSPPTHHPPTSRTWVIAAILLVFVLIVGAILITRLNQGGNGTPPLPPEKGVQIKLLVDAQCQYCFQSNTILAKFDESQIKYDLQTYDIRSPEGKALAQEFEVDYAPTALVNIKGLDQNSTIQAALQGQYIKDPLPIKKGWVVIPEKFLDKQAHLLSFINPPEACEIPTGKILITAQLDYGDCKPCAEAYNILQTLKEKYPAVEIKYSPILYNRTTPRSLLNAVNAAKGAICANQLGYLDEYTECNFFNTPFYGSLDINRMTSCLVEAGGTSQKTRNDFKECVADANSTAEFTLVQNTTTMHKWNPLLYTPSFVIDCQYSFVGQKSIEKYLCSLHPELNCTIPTPNQTDTNASTPTGNGSPDTNTGLTIIPPATPPNNGPDSNA